MVSRMFLVLSDGAVMTIVELGMSCMFLERGEIYVAETNRRGVGTHMGRIGPVCDVEGVKSLWIGLLDLHD